MTALLAIVILASLIGLLHACWKEYGPELRALTAKKSGRRRKRAARKKIQAKALLRRVVFSGGRKLLEFLSYIFHINACPNSWRGSGSCTTRPRKHLRKR